MASDAKRVKWVVPDTGQSLTMSGQQNILSKVYQMIFTNFTAYRVTKHFPATIKERKMLLPLFTHFNMLLQRQSTELLQSTEVTLTTNC